MLLLNTGVKWFTVYPEMVTTIWQVVMFCPLSSGVYVAGTRLTLTLALVSPNAAVQPEHGVTP